MSADRDLARLFLDTDRSGRAVPLLFGATLTAWNATTYANTLAVGTVTWTNVPVVNPAALTVGTVLCASTPGGPVVLGRLYQATS